MSNNDNVVLIKSKNKDKNEFVLSKQFLRCGTSVGANVREAQNSMSHAEFKSKNEYRIKRSERSRVLAVTFFGNRISFSIAI